MMKKRTYIIVIAAAAALLCFSSCNKPVYNWSEHYFHDSEEPYGTSIIYALLEEHNGKGTFHEVRGPADSRMASNKPASHKLHLGEQGADSLLTFVQRGNNAFIAAKQLPEELESELAALGCSYEGQGQLTGGTYDSIAHLNFSHPDLAGKEAYRYSFVYQNVPISYMWTHIRASSICDTGGVVGYLGTLDQNRVNFIRIPYGSGYFYIHSTPLAFTNYYLTTEEGLDYATKVFSHFNAKGNGAIYWDSFSNVPPDPGFEEERKKDETPLKYILSQEGLRWAFYITLGLLLLYIVFRAKRKQRVIPVLESRENTSLEFVQTIGTLYFQQNEHKRLAQQKMRLFLQFIRNRYNIPTNNINEELVKKIAAKSQVPASQVTSIFEQHAWMETVPGIIDLNLISFHQSIDNFYKTCK
jgi:hypothetical protein